jgi:hypothetical protein
MAGITSGGAERRAFRLGLMAVASKGGKMQVFSPLWPLAEVQASVQRGGAACRRGGRRSRRRRGGGEEEEVGDVVVPGGSGSSLGRLRSSRRTALPRAAPFLLLPSFSPFSYGGTAWLVRGVAPGAARVGSSAGGSAAALNRAARCGVRGWPGCAGSRGACRDGEATAGAPRFGLWLSAKGVKREDDDDDVGVT